MQEQPIRVLVVEDHTLVREGLLTMLAADEGLEVVGEAADGEEAVRLGIDLHPDVVLLDLRLPKVDGIEVLRRLKAHDRALRVLILTVHDEQQYVAEAVLAGADGYLLKTVNHSELTDAVRRVAGGEAVLHPSVARSVLTELTQLASGDGPTHDLSAREVEIVKLLAQGLSNKQIAVQLGLGVETIKTHISSILSKLGAVDRTQAVALAIRRGLID